MKKILSIYAVVFFFACSTSPNLSSNSGAVSSTSKLASDVGISVLKKGGNAFDAIVATGFALAVTSPANGNLGGGGFMVAHTSGGDEISLDFREKAPSAAYETMFLTDNEYDKNKAQKSHLSSGVPGTVAGLIQIYQDYGSGKFTLEELLEPAIKYASAGFPISEFTAWGLDYNKDGFIEDEGSAKVFVKNENPQIKLVHSQFLNGEIDLEEFQNRMRNFDEWKPGDILIQNDLAKTLSLISQKGKDGFYKGEIADLIEIEMIKNGGLVSKEDLENYKAVYREPVIGNYRGFKIISMSPPSSGGALLIQMLNMLENYDISSIGRNSARYAHLLTEVERLAYADRAMHLGDPDFWDNPIEMLVSKQYAFDRTKLIKSEKANKSKDIAAGTSTHESMETTHYSAIDQWGNTVAITTTINFSYGNRKIVDGAGFLLNNEMDDFTAKPGIPRVPNAFGLVGDNGANAIEPHKRPLSSMTPTIVLDKDSNAILSLGAAGGSRIITAVLQVISSVIDHGLTIDEAIDYPRIHSQWLPDILRYENTALSSDIINELESMGHIFNHEGEAEKGIYGLARVHGVQKLNKRFIAGADKRGRHNGNEGSIY